MTDPVARLAPFLGAPAAVHAGLAESTSPLALAAGGARASGAAEPAPAAPPPRAEEDDDDDAEMRRTRRARRRRARKDDPDEDDDDDDDDDDDEDEDEDDDERDADAASATADAGARRTATRRLAAHIRRRSYAKARKAERKRVAAILTHPSAAANLPLASRLAFHMRIGARAACKLLDATPAPVAAATTLDQRMASAPNPRLGPATPPAPTPQAQVDSSWDRIAARRPGALRR